MAAEERPRDLRKEEKTVTHATKQNPTLPEINFLRGQSPCTTDRTTENVYYAMLGLSKNEPDEKQQSRKPLTHTHTQTHRRRVHQSSKREEASEDA